VAHVIDMDDIDFAAYERATEAQLKVRPASMFADQLVARFKPRDRNARRPRMISTKLRHGLEFRDGETTCWAGYNGHRKSTFAGQVAIDLCSQGERVLIASFEMTPPETLARAACQAYGLGEPSERQLRRFMDWTEGRLWLFDHMGRCSPSQLLAVIRYFATDLKGQHVFIDSMMMVVASEDKLDEQKQFMTDVVRIGQETGVHMHMIAHCRKPASGDESKPPTKYDIKGTGAISDQAHNVVMVWANKAKKSALEANPNDEEALSKPDAMVIVEKQRNGAYEGRMKFWCDEASFRFTDDRMTPIEAYPMEAA
jgi:twinkle protein